MLRYEMSTAATIAACWWMCNLIAVFLNAVGALKFFPSIGKSWGHFTRVLGFSPEAREISCYLLSGSLVSQTPQLISQELGHHIGKVWRPDIDRGGTWMVSWESAPRADDQGVKTASHLLKTHIFRLLLMSTC